MLVKAEIFAVGDELCYGRVYDTNSFWIADELTKRGATVQRITCLRDNQNDIVEALKNSEKRGSDFIFITGGLGPTQDDCTLEALSKFSGQQIKISEEVLNIMSQRMGLVHGNFQPHHIRMARSLERSECLPNPLGWAPVTVIKMASAILFALPGPPKEVKACFQEYIASRVEKYTDTRSTSSRVMVTMFESELIPLIHEINDSITGVYLKPLVGESHREKGLPVEIVTFGKTNQFCKQKHDEVCAKLKKLVESRGRKIILETKLVN